MYELAAKSITTAPETFMSRITTHTHTHNVVMMPFPSYFVYKTWKFN